MQTTMIQIPPALQEKFRSKRVIVALAAAVMLLYTGASIVVVGWIRKGGGTETDLRRFLPKSSQEAGIGNRNIAPTPTPTPVPLKGPGNYACSFEGVCNLYGDKERISYCKEQETYADPNCLGQCVKKEKRCTR